MRDNVLTSRESVSASGRTWCRSFTATEDQAGEARRFLAGIVGNHPATDDAITRLAELAANAILHSRSAQPGGTFSVTLRRSARRIRIEVADQGGPWGSTMDDPERGRGLRIVRALSACQGVILVGQVSNPVRRTVWCEISLDGSASWPGQGRPQ